MVIYFNRSVQTGPWGGGNVTLKALIDHYKKNNDVVCGWEPFGARSDTNPITCVDLAFMFDPRTNDQGPGYDMFKNLKDGCGTKIIHRINETGLHGKPELAPMIVEANKLADATVFTSEWVRQWYANKYRLVPENFSIIHNAVDTELFKPKHRKRQVNFVTHHWSTNSLKGFDFYKKLITSNWFEKSSHTFTYIGRAEADFINLLNSTKNCTYIKPVTQKNLSKILPTYNAYLTASSFEAGPNHSIEAISCGLPVLYRIENKGAIAEYVGECGMGFPEDQWELYAKKFINCFVYVENNFPVRPIDDLIVEYQKVIETLK